jgi:hypothetical protein
MLIRFSNGNRARAILVPPDAGASETLEKLGIGSPAPAILVLGGAAGLSPEVSERVLEQFAGVVKMATCYGAVLIDGGTESGIMELLGRAVAAQEGVEGSCRLLGVAPFAQVSFPERPAIDANGTTLTPLDPHHSHFVLVDTDTWGGETDTIFRLAGAISQGLASVALLVDGGETTRKEIRENARARRPLIVLAGSGRLADTLAAAQAQGTDDPDLAAVLSQGRCMICSLDAPRELLETRLREALQG